MAMCSNLRSLCIILRLGIDRCSKNSWIIITQTLMNLPYNEIPGHHTCEKTASYDWLSILAFLCWDIPDDSEQKRRWYRTGCRELQKIEELALRTVLTSPWQVSVTSPWRAAAFLLNPCHMGALLGVAQYVILADSNDTGIIPVLTNHDHFYDSTSQTEIRFSRNRDASTVTHQFVHE